MAFKKGESGNPGGRPRVVAHVRELAQVHTEEAVRTLARVMTDPDESGKTRAYAANSLLDRACGKPAQAHKIEDDDPDGNGYQIIIQRFGKAGPPPE